MSDVNFYGVLQMPYELAMSDELSRRQFYSVVQEAVKRLHKLEQPARTIKESLNVEPAQEPVAWYGTGDMHIWKRNLEDNEDATLKVTNRPKAHNGNWIPLYTHPAPAQPLSDDEIDDILESMGNIKDWNYIEFARAIEQALKEKNT